MWLLYASQAPGTIPNKHSCQIPICVRCAYVSFTAGALATNTSCAVVVNVTGASSGQFTNTTGVVSSTNGGSGNTASANLSVAAPPTIAKSFGATTIPFNGATTLSFTITNSNTALPLTGVAFTDNLPAGLVVSTPPVPTGSCGNGTITAAAGATSITLAAGAVAANGSCTFSVNVTGITSGVQSNTTGAVSSTQSGSGVPSNTATLTVLAPPSITKTFGAANIALGASTTLSFTIANPNASTGLTGTAVTDNLPAGLVVSTPPVPMGSCGTGTLLAAADATSITLTGGTIPASGSCTFGVNVTGIIGGNQVNTTGAVSSSNGRTGNTASASVTVLVPDLTIAKSHVGNFKQGLTGASYTITVSNAGTVPTLGSVTVTDTLPSALTATAIAGTGWTCTLSPLSCTRSDVLASSGSYPPLTLTVNVSGTAPASVTNTAVVAGGGETNTANDTVTDVTSVDVVPPDFSITASPASITVKAGQKADYTLTLVPLNNVPFSTAITLTATGMPTNTKMVFEPATVTPGASPGTTAFVVMTSASDPFLASNDGGRPTPLLAVGMPLFGVLFIGIGIGFRKKYGLTLKPQVAAVLLLVVISMTVLGCANASKFRALGTPPGTYLITVTGTGGTGEHSTTVTLAVTP